MQFKEIKGYDSIKKKLIQTVKSNRVSHAQLFLGPEGNAKLALAIAYAQYINCENPAEDSCGVCHSCIKYNKLIHPDLHFVFPVTAVNDIKKPVSRDFLVQWRECLIKNDYFVDLDLWFETLGVENKQGIINADDCNEIIKTLSYTSYESEYKVMIIWMVEKLFHAAAPKLLKILEEPPDKTLFILISENQSQIISTILSRTQIIKIPPMEEHDLLELMVEKNEADRTKAKKITRYVNGNYIEAVKMLEKEDGQEDEVLLFRNWMRACFKSDVIAISTYTDKFASYGREGLKSFLQHCTELIGDFVQLNHNIITIDRYEGEEKQFMNDFARFVNTANAGKLYAEFNNAVFYIERNANPSLVLMDLSLKLNRILLLK